MNINDFKSENEIAWCPGCGDFGVLTAVKKALVKIGRSSKDILLVSGIGQAAKLPHYVKANCFNGLHGRALPAAVGAKIANRGLTVVVTTGDGDCYGEGGNHLIHNIRRNVDITVVVCDNQVYGLTKGQASPTSDLGFENKVQPAGVIVEPLHPLELAIALDCGFVARGFSADNEQLTDLIVEGINYQGFSLIDVLQPCVTFNKKNTHEWYSQRVYKIADVPGYDPFDKMAAYRKSAEWGERIPLGVIYRNNRSSYEQKSGLAQLPPLVEQPLEDINITRILNDLR
jgi:2-oxoglutarate/2-oxoacid ferredoxin oxidoreductase subunit beta